LSDFRISLPESYCHALSKLFDKLMLLPDEFINTSFIAPEERQELFEFMKWFETRYAGQKAKMEVRRRWQLP